jgi:hypothetical protein
MSQVAYPKVPVAVRSHWLLTLSALIALVATILVILAVSIGGGSSDTQAVSTPASGPNESAVAAAVAPRPSPAPDESRIATSIDTGAAQPSAGPDESRTASSLGR